MYDPDPAEARQRLELLRNEYDLAVSIGLDSDPCYMAELTDELATWQAAWIGARVTELAVRRAGVLGRQQG